jgi:tRNA-splicing ligase RtcB
MTTREFDGVTLERVRKYVWEMPREGDMRVPARVFASEALLEEIADDMTLQQLRNSTQLPGIARYAACMPDAHQGYGFPVGGVGAIDAETGCISPGAIGYDINCLAGDSEVRLSFGRRRRIRDLWTDFEDERVVVPDGEHGATSNVRLFTATGDRTVYQVETEAGTTVEATADHPFATPEGMVELGDLDPGDAVFVDPFEGVRDETPPEFVVLDESDFADEDPQLVRVLNERDLLPLRSTDEAFARLLKLVGYHTGDGSFGPSQVHFYGDPASLDEIASDVEALGFTPAHHERERDHEINGREFSRTGHRIYSGSNALKQLLIRLGAPDGRTVDSDFGVPDYLDRLADWQRALYLSAFFGAEMSAPAAVSRTNFYAPSISHNRSVENYESGEEFVRDLMRHLNDLGVRTNALEEVERSETAAGEVVRFRFGVSSEESNLERFLSRVGYRYAAEKRRKASVAIQYLRRKERVVDRRARIAEEVRAMADGGASVSSIVDRFADEVNRRFVERSIYDERDGRPRPPADFPSFEEFLADTPVRGDGTVEADIAGIRELGTKPVFDIGVAHDAHRFVANGFVVSNCGVRMLTTNLDYDDLRGREEELVDALFDAVPSGLGGGGVVETDVGTVDAILDRGVEWALSEGYATPDDLAHCEDEGRRPDADPSAVSTEAKERGATQVGSLGSGNHFLEVQRVTDVYREDVADTFGLRPDGVVVLIHCGSRGLGHQVCTDYLRRIEREHADLLEDLPDRELAAAPAGSALAAEYYGAMCASINFAWTNRQLITHQVRETFADVFDAEWEELGMDLLYDVAHNIGKRETHEVPVGPDGLPSTDADAVDRAKRELFVHRKGATRAFPAGRPELPPAYADVGQPILIPGSMGSGSYVLRGGERSLDLTFGSTAHGAGRLMSRTQAKQEFWGETVRDELRDQQAIYVKAQSGATVAEEAPGVYKDVDEVVRVSDELGIGDRVARTFPVCNIKG